MIKDEVIHHFSSGVYARQQFLPANHYIKTHKHKFDHLSILASGECFVKCGDDVQKYSGPHCLEIKAGINHEIIAVTDSIWFCIHATNEVDPEKIDQQTTIGE